MQEIDFAIPEHFPSQTADQLVEGICAQMGLRLTLKGSLASRPGCIHWHFKNGTQRGTLELTLEEDNRRLWAKVQAGRKADWIDEMLPHLQKAIETSFENKDKA